jgi:hypothetical protein
MTHAQHNTQPNMHDLQNSPCLKDDLVLLGHEVVHANSVCMHGCEPKFDHMCGEAVLQTQVRLSSRIWDPK